MKKKLLLDLRILIVFAALFYFGFFYAAPWGNADTALMLLGGASAGFAGILGVYLIVSWLFYDHFKKFFKSK